MNRKPIRAVIDTNVVVSAWMTPTGTCQRLMDRFESTELRLVLSMQVMREYERILTGPKMESLHGVAASQVRLLINRLASIAVVVEPGETPGVILADPTDDIFIACAVSGHARFIVTGDKHLLELGSYQGIQILRPADMLQLLSRVL